MRLVMVLLVISVVACKEREREQANPPHDRQAAPHEAPPIVPPPAAPPPAACQAGQPICVGDDVMSCAADGTVGRAVETCKGACRNGRCVDTCAINDVELVYVVDNANTLYSFDPRKLPADPFHAVGTLACDPSSTPNSMAVDRSGIAWVGYQSGKLYRVSIGDAHCAATGAAPRGAPTTFGMGFVTDGPASRSERLFVSGTQSVQILATLDTAPTPSEWRTIAPLDAPQRLHPELTGTGDGRLFAYFPAPGRGFVQELDRATAKVRGQRWTLDGEEGRVEAYAFAFWGGVFYVFTTVDGNSAVHAIHMQSGKQELVKDKLPYEIVGAGVSTCAPLLERAPD